MKVKEIICGDALEELKKLPSESIDCCITSPPYFGLRDYGVSGQIGLEETPEQYVQKLVEIFREVKRILKKEGTFWLNLGDSYWANRAENGQSYDDNEVQRKRSGGKGHKVIKPKDLIGIPWRVVFALQQPYEEHLIKSEIDRAYIAGLVDGEGCITIQKTKSSHSGSLSFPPIVQIRMCDTEAIDHFADLIGVKRSEAELYNSSKKANQRPSYNVKATAEKGAALIADIYPYLKVKRKQAVVAWNHQMFRSARGNQERKKGELEKEQFCKDLINRLNQREEVKLPDWMIEPKFKIEPGWYLRQDLIWAKPNPMPESVTDRCTKAHEYIFLLTKSPKYYFEQILEPLVENSDMAYRRTIRAGRKYGVKRPYQDNQPLSYKNSKADKNTTQKNKRSVWTITTKPFKGAHFATFPEDLVVPMIKAGCPEFVCKKCGKVRERIIEKIKHEPTEIYIGKATKEYEIGKAQNPSDTKRRILESMATERKEIGLTDCGCNAGFKPGIVLDPFFGAGTTGVVAKKLQRNYIGIELNPEYIKIAEKRLNAINPML